MLYDKGTVVYEEPLLPISENNQPADGQLLLQPQELLAVCNSDGTLHYDRGIDFELDGKRMILTSESRIPFFTSDVLYPEAKAPMAKGTQRGSNRWLLWDEQNYIRSRQLLVSYTHHGWDIPTAHKAGFLPRTRQALEQKSDLRITVWGDSISAGGNASAYIQRSPWQPAYPERLCLMLERNHDLDCTLTNIAVPGTTSVWGLENVHNVLPTHPSLCIIAFGMNDGFHKTPPATYADNIAEQMRRIREVSPECEFVLLATMWGNPNRAESGIELYEDYRDALAALCGEGCALADLTTPWQEFLARKRPISLYANGLNHPGDWGHAFYAQTIYRAIVSE